jgi:hypothetical protein
MTTLTNIKLNSLKNYLSSSMKRLSNYRTLKNGNYFGASTHFITANWLIRNSKKGDFD